MTNYPNKRPSVYEMEKQVQLQFIRVTVARMYMKRTYLIEGELSQKLLTDPGLDVMSRHLNWKERVHNVKSLQ